MDKRFFRNFRNRRSAWTFGFCLVGVLMAGSIVALDKTISQDQGQPETVREQAYLEEGVDPAVDEEDVNDTLLSDLDEEASIMAEDEEINVASVDNASDNVDNAAGDPADSSAEDSGAVLSDGENAEDGVPAGMEASASDLLSEETVQESAPEAEASSLSETAEASSGTIIAEADLLAASVAFDSENSTLLWPSAGTILIDYSMDGSVYFPTLNQYQYNPALIIGSEVGNQVVSAARGIVESIVTDEVTGLTMTVNIGNDYRLTYGQLKEVAVQEGDLVDAGTVLGYVSEPTRYYIKEGSNLYFQMTRGGEPVDPVLYLE